MSADATLGQVYKYLESCYKGIGGMSQFRKEWAELTDDDKKEIKQLVGAEIK